MGKATQDLRSEHDSILHVLKILDKVLASTSKTDTEILQFGNELTFFLKTFADKCHHGKEEGFFFVELEKNGIPNEGGPIGMMLLEHKQGREYIAQMDQSLASKDLPGFKEHATQYRNLLVNHIAKENDVLFMMADRVLDDQKQDALFEKFENHEETVIGHGVHEELHAKIHQWEEQFT